MTVATEMTAANALQPRKKNMKINATITNSAANVNAVGVSDPFT
jgi:hypothetical protein